MIRALCPDLRVTKGASMASDRGIAAPEGNLWARGLFGPVRIPMRSRWSSRYSSRGLAGSTEARARSTWPLWTICSK